MRQTDLSAAQRQTEAAAVALKARFLCQLREEAEGRELQGLDAGEAAGG